MFTLQKYNPQQGIRLLFCHILTVRATKKSLLKTKANRTFLNFAKEIMQYSWKWSQACITFVNTRTTK